VENVVVHDHWLDLLLGAVQQASVDERSDAGTVVGVGAQGLLGGAMGGAMEDLGVSEGEPCSGGVATCRGDHLNRFEV